MSSHHSHIQRPHTVEHPCRMCRRDTPALDRGVLQERPICPGCRGRFEQEHKLARRQADQQWAAEQRARRPRKSPVGPPVAGEEVKP